MKTLTSLVKEINNNHRVKPEGGMKNPLMSGGKTSISRRMVGEALAHVQGGNTQRLMRLSHQRLFHSPITTAGEVCRII